MKYDERWLPAGKGSSPASAFSPFFRLCLIISSFLVS